MVVLLVITYLSIPQPTQPIPLESVSRDEVSQFQYTEPEYYSILQKYSYLMASQPTHRDILINSSLLYLAQGDTAKANELYIAARQLDPNNPFFQE